MQLGWNPRADINTSSASKIIYIADLFLKKETKWKAHKNLNHWK